MPDNSEGDLNSMESRFRLKKIGEERFLLDVRGQVCPYPELLTIRAVKSLKQGDILDIVTDNPPSVRDVPLTLRGKGYNVEEPASLDGGGWRLTVKV
jgi:tRNA 2-thiouridine synthesizing protein A